MMLSVLDSLVAAHPIVHVNATLNCIATVLLVTGFYLIKQGRVGAHKRTMLTAFGVSIAFLGCYVWYHFVLGVGSVRFTHPGPVRYVYLTILASHVVLAAIVPFLAIYQIYLGFRALGCCDPASDAQQVTTESFRRKHIHLARWTFPIWLYVSVTGVIIYLMLYHLWPPGE